MSRPKPAIVVFPASNCDKDMEQILREVYDIEPVMLWHEQKQLPPDITHVILPGGFSYGDYLRAGAIASHSPIMKSVKNQAALGLPVLGICNGFQILCEAKLLPGVLLKNHHHRFVCKLVETKFFGLKSELNKAINLKLAIAHQEGRYFAPKDVLDSLVKNRQIILTYTEQDSLGNAQINGSYLSIAGVVAGPKKNIFGLMPHPERMASKYSPGQDGCVILQEFLFGLTR